jgi:hypothetical protein
VSDKPPDIDILFADLAATHPGKGRYHPQDRYADYRAVFLGDDQGKRVLYDILSMAHMFASSPVLCQFDSHKTFFAEGERNMALRIFDTARNEPRVAPAKRQVSRPPEES